MNNSLINLYTQVWERDQQNYITVKFPLTQCETKTVQHYLLGISVVYTFSYACKLILHVSIISLTVNFIRRVDDCVGSMSIAQEITSILLAVKSSLRSAAYKRQTSYDSIRVLFYLVRTCLPDSNRSQWSRRYYWRSGARRWRRNPYS